MYDDFSAEYDLFIDWPSRLAAELPFVERQLQAAGAHRLLDAACGTGMHAIALAQLGYAPVGADLSPGMIECSRANAAAAGVDVPFHVAGLGDLEAQVGSGFDGVLCLGNSLPHVLTADALALALSDLGACLRPGGLLLLQNRNFDAVLARGERWMEPQARSDGTAEWVFLRFYDLEGNGTLTFNLVTLRRRGAEPWTQRVSTTRLRPLLQTELVAALGAAGFVEVACYGDLQGVPFEPARSPDLVVTALRPAQATSVRRPAPRSART
jgi:glycine/sarcosine N-methyltransferase